MHALPYRDPRRVGLITVRHRARGDLQEPCGSVAGRTSVILSRVSDERSRSGDLLRQERRQLLVAARPIGTPRVGDRALHLPHLDVGLQQVVGKEVVDGGQDAPGRDHSGVFTGDSSRLGGSASSALTSRWCRRYRHSCPRHLILGPQPERSQRRETFSPSKLTSQGSPSKLVSHARLHPPPIPRGDHGEHARRDGHPGQGAGRAAAGLLRAAAR